MNKKKLIIILSSVAVVIVAGLVVSHFTNWPVDISKTEGDIGKAARFSREDQAEKTTNLEELLKTDSAYKEGVVVAYVLMQARAAQFASLVDVSNQVAGQIPEYAALIQDMKKTNSMVSNVNTQLEQAGKNLDDVLGGKECPDLEQSAINASLAYNQLQKQNTLADRFIATTDKYLANAKGSDQLKLVRDQWVDYQKMTATLEDNKASAKELEKKGYLLTAEKADAALGAFAEATQKLMRLNTCLSEIAKLNSSLGGRVTTNSEKLGMVISNKPNLGIIIKNSAIMNQASGAMNNHTKLGDRLNVILVNSEKLNVFKTNSEKLNVFQANSEKLGRGPR